VVSIYIKKIVILFYSSFAGMLIGGTAITGLISWINFAAQDGPLFPPTLVTLALMIPVMIVLLLIEIGVLGYELTTKRDLGKELLIVGLISGLISSLLLHEILITPYQDELDILRLLVFLGLGILIGLSTFGSHWLGNLAWNYLYPPTLKMGRRNSKP